MSAVFYAINRRLHLTLRCMRRGGWPFFLGIVFDAFSQIVQILSIFVPLKVIYLVGSGTVPQYLSSVWPSGDLDSWAWLLTGIAVALFAAGAGLSRLGQRLAHLAARRTADRIAISNPELGKKTLRVLRSLVVSNSSLTTDLLICGLFLMFLVLLDHLFFGLAMGLVSVSMVTMGCVILLGRRYEFFARLWRLQFASFIESLMLVLFLLFFVAMVAIILAGYDLGFLRSLIVLILTRRLLQALERAVKRHRVIMQKSGIEYLLQ